jgi:DNA-binding NtrC family response regulator
VNKYKNVLIVDNDNSVLNSFRDFLILEGFNPDIARSGREAVEKSKSKDYDLALLDNKLIEVEGEELLSDIQRENPHIIEIMIEKPINPKSVLRIVKKLGNIKENEYVIERIRLFKRR